MQTSLTTRYLGLQLAHPIIVAASSLTASTEGVQKAWEHGAAAVVLKSLFEEQVAADTSLKPGSLDDYPHPEALDYVKEMGMQIGPRDYLELIGRTRKAVPIPVIASINCAGSTWWTEFAKQVEESGASAIELNIGFLPENTKTTGQDLEKRMFDLIAKVVSHVKIPLAVKLGNAWSSLPNVIKNIEGLGVSSVVLFNRFYQVDISLETMALKSGVAFSSEHDYYQSLRWVAMLHGETSLDLCAGGGIHSAQSALKVLAAGASAVQICSAVYKHGYKIISTMVREMEEWLGSKGHKDLEGFRGSMARVNSKDPARYNRIQYIKALTGMY